MKARGKNALLLLTGMLVGLALAPTAANAVSELLTATPSTQTFYVDGQRVELEAYGINGYNYVKLRDVGQLVDFNVCYDPSRNAAIIEPDKPYTGEDVTAPTPIPSVQPSEGADYAAQANPAVFTGELTREIYNGIRDSIVHQDAIVAGDYKPVSMGPLADNDLATQATSAINRYPRYSIVSQPDGTAICEVRPVESYEAAVQHTQAFVDSLAGKSQRDKVADIAWYVCDRVTYTIAYPSPGEVLSQDGQVPGCCMAYSYSFQLLCNRAGIPCILIQSATHQWNRVYVDGQWWDIDVTNLDAGDDTHHRSYATILHEASEMQGRDFVDRFPEVSSFAMELLVPGSTK